MRPRLLNVVLAGAIALAAGFIPMANADLTGDELTETLVRVRAMKRQMNMERAQQRILKARVAARPHKKLPKGYSLKLARKTEGGIEARVRDLQATGRLPVGAASGAAPARALGGSFGPNKRMNDPLTDLFPDAGQSETTVAATGNNILVAWNDGNGFDLSSPAYQLMSFGYSTDGGATWTDGGGFPQAPGFPNWQWTSDPVLVVNETNNEFIFTGLCFPNGPPEVGGTLNGLAVVKGTFSGPNFTWGTPVLIASGSNANTFYDKQWHAVDPANGNLYLTYTRFTLTGDGIEYRRSTDGGTSWSSATVISAPGDDGYVQGSRVVVGPNSEVYAVWQAVGPVDKDYFKLRKSTNAGLSFASELIAASYYSNFSSGAPGFNRERGITYPGIAVDRTNGPSRGRVYLTWNECIDFYPNLGGGAGAKSEVESNNTFGTATPFTIGNTVRGTLATLTDIDFFSFSATQGQTYVFYVDSLSTGLDMAFRLICSDGTTRLAVSSPGIGLGSIIVWTAPANGTYCIRPAAWDPPSTAGPHPYRIRTTVHSPLAGDKARDHRDIFVSSSADGITWPTTGPGAPVLVNADDPAWFDNWLPEVAITGHSRVFCTWYDWRDSSPSSCGGQSNLYLYRSNDAGGSWSNLGQLTDATTAWTGVASNVAPNQGDYVSLFANYTGVYAAWGDGRDGNPNVYGLAIPIATPTLASLATARIDAGRVELDWLAADYANRSAELERREGESEWTVVGSEFVSGEGRVTFVDATVTAGRTYTYRLAFGGADYSQETEVRVPSGATLALAAPQPNPVVEDLWIAFSLPNSAPATLSLLDVSGRAVRREDVGALGAGEHRLNLGRGERLAAGVYVVVLRQGDRVLTRRVSVVR